MIIKIRELPPTVNHAYGHKGSIVYLKKEAVAFINRFKAIVAKFGYSMLLGRIELKITFTVNNKRRWDIDNRVKILQDSVVKSRLIKDDSQVDSLIVRRIYGEEVSTMVDVKELVT